MKLMEKSVEKEDAIAGYYRSEQAKNNAAVGRGASVVDENIFGSFTDTGKFEPYPFGRGIGRMSRSETFGLAGQDPTMTGQIQLEPSEVKTRKRGHPGVTAGEKPMYEERQLMPHFYMMMPESGEEGPMEVLNEMSLPAFAGLILQNKKFT